MAAETNPPPAVPPTAGNSSTASPPASTTPDPAQAKLFVEKMFEELVASLKAGQSSEAAKEFSKVIAASVKDAVKAGVSEALLERYLQSSERRTNLFSAYNRAKELLEQEIFHLQSDLRFKVPLISKFITIIAYVFMLIGIWTIIGPFIQRYQIIERPLKANIDHQTGAGGNIPNPTTGKTAPTEDDQKDLNKARPGS
jgi:hypothetical protein